MWLEAARKEEAFSVKPVIAKRESIGQLKFDQDAETAIIMRDKQWSCNKTFPVPPYFTKEEPVNADLIQQLYFDRLQVPDSAPDNDFTLHAYYKFGDVNRAEFEPKHTQRNPALALWSQSWPWAGSMSVGG